MSATRLSRSSVRAFSVLSKASTSALRSNIIKSLKFKNTITSSPSPLRSIQKVNFSTTRTTKYSLIENEDAAPLIDFSQMQEIANKDPADSKYVIVDVREPDEFSAGHIPNAINIPVKSSPGALGLHPDEFKLTFGFDKPSTEKTLVFYCLAGVRATMSEELAYTFGYEHRLNFIGSFKEWLDNKGEVETPEPTESKPESTTESKTEPKDESKAEEK